MAKKTLIMAAVVVALCSAALAERQLERSEVLGIFGALTQTPQKTWIPAGSIQATHQQYQPAQTTDVNEINARIAKEIENYTQQEDKRELTDEQQQMKLNAIPFNVRYK